MDKAYDPKSVEGAIYKLWEEGGYFTPKINKKKKPFTILLPLPNANDPMHMGHAMFVIQDILIRYHRMNGDPTLWLPGGDHAGIETQYVFEKKLAKEGKSRFQFDRETLYRMIEAFVETNKNINREQLKRLGFSLDWTRYHYSLEPKIVATVLDTFRKMHEDNLVYRDSRLVNYCTHDGTGFSDLEVKHVQRSDPLYYMKYGPFILATTRPETKFGDTAVAVNPKDKRYTAWIGKEIEVEGLLGPFKVVVVADDVIDPAFGTGVAKVTPAHDFTDYEIAKRHNLPAKQVIGFDGRLTELAGPYKGMKVGVAREQIVKDMQTRGMIDHIDTNYIHTVATCYKCGNVLEPLPIPQWYVRTKSLAMKAMKAVKEGKTKIVPKKRFEKMYFDWMNNILDWNISRQIVWGPRIPVWYCLDCNPDISIHFIDIQQNKIFGDYQNILSRYNFAAMKDGLQSLSAPLHATYSLSPEPCKKCGGTNILQETDTFDTWFLSSQWPLTTLGFPDGEDFKYFYPTSVLDTMWDILFFWVARMMMMGIYRTGNVPFEVINLHSRVVDAKGQKMAKSKGNVLNPVDLVDTYGADALRFTLVFGSAPGGDIAVSEDKIRGMRNFANKIWNASRFIMLFQSEKDDGIQDNEFKKKIKDVTKKVTSYIEKYRFNSAAELLYESFWHWFCDQAIEQAKTGDISKDALQEGLLTYLKLLHPFMPFVTEEIWSKMPASPAGGPRKTDRPLIISSWPVR
jgi:valyl-tRNA synthetase